MVSLFTDLSSEMIYPLLPVFLSSVLGASAFELGVIEGVAETTASLMKIISGLWSDRLPRRKPLIFSGYAISGFFRPLIALTHSWQSVLGVRFLDRVGKGMRSSPRDSLIADVTPSDRRGAAFGLHRAADHAGAVGGPLIAASLLMIPGMDLRRVFLFASIPAIIGVVIILVGLKEKSVERSVLQTESPLDFPTLSPRALLRGWKDLGSEFKVFLTALIIFSLGNSTDAFLLIRLSKAGVATQSIALIWSLHHVVKMLGNYYGGKLSDQLGRRFTLIIGWIFFAVIYFAFAFVDSPITLTAVFLCYGLYFGFTEPSERALVADLASPSVRGAAFGYFHFTLGLTALPASVIFGWVWQSWGASAAFTMGATLAVMGSLLLIYSKTVPRSG